MVEIDFTFGIQKNCIGLYCNDLIRNKVGTKNNIKKKKINKYYYIDEYYVGTTQCIAYLIFSLVEI